MTQGPISVEASVPRSQYHGGSNYIGHMGARPFPTHRSVSKAMELGRAYVQTAQLLTSLC